MIWWHLCGKYRYSSVFVAHNVFLVRYFGHVTVSIQMKICLRLAICAILIYQYVRNSQCSFYTFYSQTPVRWQLDDWSREIIPMALHDPYRVSSKCQKYRQLSPFRLLLRFFFKESTNINCIWINPGLKPRSINMRWYMIAVRPTHT